MIQLKGNNEYIRCLIMKTVLYFFIKFEIFLLSKLQQKRTLDVSRIRGLVILR